MKRIILGLSVFFMLVENSFAKTDAEYDIKISEQKTEVWKQIWRCNKVSGNHKYNGDINICLKSIDMQKAQGVKEKYLAIDYLNVGAMYASQGDKLKAYKYYMKSANLDNTTAQSNLSVLCKQNPWACK